MVRCEQQVDGDPWLAIAIKIEFGKKFSSKSNVKMRSTRKNGMQQPDDWSSVQVDWWSIKIYFSYLLTENVSEQSQQKKNRDCLNKGVYQSSEQLPCARGVLPTPLGFICPSNTSSLHRRLPLHRCLFALLLKLPCQRLIYSPHSSPETFSVVELVT